MQHNLAQRGMKPDEVLGTLLGPWGATSPQTDLERHKMEKMLTSALADSSETRSAKQELEKLLSLRVPAETTSSEPDNQPAGSIMDSSADTASVEQARDTKQHPADTDTASS